MFVISCHCVQTSIVKFKLIKVLIFNTTEFAREMISRRRNVVYFSKFRQETYSIHNSTSQIYFLSFVFHPFVWDSKARDEGSTVTVVSEERLDGTDATHTRAVSSLSTLYLGWPSHLYSKTESRNGEAGTGVEFVCRANVCRRHRRTLVPSSLWSLVQVCPDH